MHCEVDWEPWSACSNGERSRSQIVLVEAEGSGGNACPDLETETEGKEILVNSVAAKLKLKS